jgi:nucleoside-diphosphate-sugar epimerase
VLPVLPHPSLGIECADATAAYDISPIPDEESLKSMEVPLFAYVNSKILSHHAGTNFMTEHPNASFDLVRIMPGYVQGANELATKVCDITSGSAEGVINVATGNVSGEVPKLGFQVLLDDVATAHVFVLDSKKVKGGQNLICVSNNGDGYEWDEFVPLIQELYPEEVKKGIFRPEKGQLTVRLRYDVREAEETLGFSFSGPKEMVKSVLDQYLELEGQ